LKVRRLESLKVGKFEEVEVGDFEGRRRMGKISRFEEIEAFQSARDLMRVVYRLSNEGAFSRDFGLRDELRRAAVSIMSNIAEGFESRTRSLFIDFLGRAKASAGELRAQCYVALDVGYLPNDVFEDLQCRAEVCSKQLSNFVSYLKSL
jgi:four helix bundle protein